MKKLKLAKTLARKEFIIKGKLKVQEEEKKVHLKMKRHYYSYKDSISVPLSIKYDEIVKLQTTCREHENTNKTIIFNFAIKVESPKIKVKETKEKNHVSCTLRS